MLDAKTNSRNYCRRNLDRSKHMPQRQLKCGLMLVINVSESNVKENSSHMKESYMLLVYAIRRS